MNRFVPRSHLTPPEFRISNTKKVFDRNSIFDKQTSCPIFFIQTYEYKLIILRFWSFLSQFDDIAPAYNLNEKELNILIFNFMADEIRSKYMTAYAKHPKDISSKEFYSNVASIVIGHPATYSSL